MELGTRRKAHNFETLVSDSSNVRLGSFASILVYARRVRFAPDSDRRADMVFGSFVPCMDGARGAREKSDISASGSGAAMYTAFECGRCGRWP